MKKGREKGGKVKKEKSDKRHIKPLWSLNDRKKATKTRTNFRGGRGEYFSGWPEYIPLLGDGDWTNLDPAKLWDPRESLVFSCPQPFSSQSEITSRWTLKGNMFKKTCRCLYCSRADGLRRNVKMLLFWVVRTTYEGGRVCVSDHKVGGKKNYPFLVLFLFDPKVFKTCKTKFKCSALSRGVQRYVVKLTFLQTLNTYT